MPIIIHGRPLHVRGNRGRHFDLKVRTLAPSIAEVRASGSLDVRQIAKCLNERGLVGSSGRPLSYGAMHRILVRLEKLHLGPGPRTRSKAASNRPYTPRETISDRSALKRLINSQLRHLK